MIEHFFYRRCDRFLSLWETERCKMIEMSCDQHDEYAANSQFITHLTGNLHVCIHKNSCMYLHTDICMYESIYGSQSTIYIRRVHPIFTIFFWFERSLF